MKLTVIVSSLFALSCCTTQDRPAPATEGTNAPAEASHSTSTAGTPAPGATAPAFLARYTATTVPEAISTGKFSVESSCVVYTPAGSSTSFLALLPASTRFLGEADAPTGLTFDGRDVRFGEVVRMTGGTVPVDSLKSYGVTATVPAACPKSAYVIGGFLNASP